MEKKTEELTNFAVAAFQNSSKAILSLSFRVCTCAYLESQEEAINKKSCLLCLCAFVFQ